MKERGIAPDCGRGSELMALLYNELSDTESADLERHIEDCSVCHSELVAFRGLRDSIVGWKRDALGNLLSPAVAAPTFAFKSSDHDRKPSAVAAIREFFALSPLWMKGALALGSVLFCIFAFLAVARWREKPTSPGTATNERAYSPDELQAMVEELAQKRVRDLTSQGQTTAIVPETPMKNPRKALKQPKQSATEVAYKVSLKPRRPLTRIEREQLAADLRLLPSDDDVDMDLVDDRVNRPN